MGRKKLTEMLKIRIITVLAIWLVIIYEKQTFKEKNSNLKSFEIVSSLWFDLV